MKRYSAYSHLWVNDHIVAGRSFSSIDNLPTHRFHLGSAAGMISFLVLGSKIANYLHAFA